MDKKPPTKKHSVNKQVLFLSSFHLFLHDLQEKGLLDAEINIGADTITIQFQENKREPIIKRDVFKYFTPTAEKIALYCKKYEVPTHVVRTEMEKFTTYWKEKSISGRKMRYEKEKVFDIELRFNTWMRNVQERLKKQMGRPMMKESFQGYTPPKYSL